MSLTKNAVFNTAGTVLPLFLSLLTIPVYLSWVGDARYGIIALVWLLFGYFGLFDLGLSRATANRLARPENQAPEKQSELFWTALVINTLLGIVGGAVFLVAAGPILTSFTSIPADLVKELRAAVPWIACLLPLSTTSSVFTGTLESRERFFELNVFQLIGASLTQIAPLLGIYLYGPSIEVVIAATALARLVPTAPMAAMAFKQSRSHSWPRLYFSTIKDLFAYGGWVTITNIVGPILVSIDQFMIGSILGVRAVPHYAIPFNLATKVLIVPSAMTRALFPQLSKANAADAQQRADTIAGTIALTLAMFCVPGMFLAEYALHVWLGKDFSNQTSTVTRIILLGVWINGVAFLPFVLLQSQGRPDLPAKLHMLELLPFVAILWLCLHAFSLPGAAIAWVVRVTADAGLMFWAAGFSRGFVGKISPTFIIVVVAFAASVSLPANPVANAALAVGAFATIAAYAYSRDATIRRLYHQSVSAYSSK